jgi:alanine-synthesizing transaminase
MPGWRVGFMVGNPVLVNALARIKSYFDYGTFTPIQVAIDRRARRPAGVRRTRSARTTASAATCWSRGSTSWAGRCPAQGHHVCLGARFPEQYRKLGSLEFSKLLLTEAKTAVSPGIGFGDYGDGHVRFSLIENEERTRQALRGIKQMLAKGVLTAVGS